MPKSPVSTLVDDFGSEYREFAAKLIPRIRQYLDDGLSADIAVRRAFEDYDIPHMMRVSIAGNVVMAAAIGFDVKMVADAEDLGSYFLNHYWPGDKLNLSQRIAAQEYRQVIINHIQTGMRQQKAYREIAQRLTDISAKDWRPSGRILAELPKVLREDLIPLSRSVLPDDKELQKSIRKAQRYIDSLAPSGAPTKNLKASYQAIVDRINDGLEARVNKQIEIAVMEKGRYNAERIARTEIARAHGVAHDFKSSIDEDVIGVKYSLSTRHPEYDICDFHTKANLYDMGPGVYPKSKHPPYPFHPHCLCVPSQVYRTETELNTDMDGRQGEQFIKSQSKVEQTKLLGAHGRKEWKNGDDWRLHLKNWEGHHKPDFSGIKKEWFVKEKQ